MCLYLKSFSLVKRIIEEKDCKLVIELALGSLLGKEPILLFFYVIVTVPVQMKLN